MSGEDNPGATDGSPPPETAAAVTEESPYTLPGFFDALGDGRLLAIECQHCDHVAIPPRPACNECGSRDVVLGEQPHEGTVYTYTEVRRPPTAFEAEAPYVIAVVELDSGARLIGQVDAPLDEVDIGMPVRLTTRESTAEDGVTALPVPASWPVHGFEPN